MLLACLRGVCCRHFVVAVVVAAAAACLLTRAREIRQDRFFGQVLKLSMAKLSMAKVGWVGVGQPYLCLQLLAVSVFVVVSFFPHSRLSFFFARPANGRYHDQD